MAVKKSQRREPRESSIKMALAALEPSPNPLDMPVERFDPSPTALGLDDGDESETWSNPRCSGSGVEACIVCGESLRSTAGVPPRSDHQPLCVLA